MASTITHAFFVLDVYNKLDSNLRKFLMDEVDTLKVSAQGMDPLFFYKILYLNKGSRVREFGDYYHRNNTKDFFTTMINYIKYNGYAFDSHVMAFLYGLISHMVLDSKLHPFIIYKTGEFNKDDKNTYKYNMLHGEVESYIDNYLISLKFNTVPRKFKCYDYCFNIEMSSRLKEIVNFTFKEIFDVNNMSKFYVKSVNDMKMFYYIFRYDPYGIKRKFYKFVDFVSPRSFRRKVPLSYDIPSMKSYLNLEHKIWYNPANKKIKSNSSVTDIYTDAVNYCVDLINKINLYIYEDIGNLDDIILNISYVTGLDLDKCKQDLVFFEF